MSQTRNLRRSVERQSPKEVGLSSILIRVQVSQLMRSITAS